MLRVCHRATQKILNLNWKLVKICLFTCSQQLFSIQPSKNFFHMLCSQYKTNKQSMNPETGHWHYNLVTLFLICHIFVAKLFQVIPPYTNPGISACRAALCRYMYFHLYKHRQPVPSHQAGEPRNPCNLPQCQKTNKKAEKWIHCVCVPFCSPVSPGVSKVGSNGADRFSYCFTFSLLLVLCASYVHSYFVVCLILFLFGVNTQEIPTLAHKQEVCGWHKGSQRNKKWFANRPCLSSHDPNDHPSPGNGKWDLWVGM